MIWSLFYITHLILMREKLSLSPSYGWRNWGIERINPKVIQGLVAKPSFEFRQSGPGSLFLPTTLFTERRTMGQKGQLSIHLYHFTFSLQYYHLLPNKDVFINLNPKVEKHLGWNLLPFCCCCWWWCSRL